jgi:hypothetical protein
MRPTRKYVVPGWLSRHSDSLRAGRAGDRIPVGEKFPTPIQTGPMIHPASYTMGTGSYPGVQRPARRVDHPPASSADVTNNRAILLRPLWGFVFCSRVTFTITLHRHIRDCEELDLEQ